MVQGCLMCGDGILLLHDDSGLMCTIDRGEGSLLSHDDRIDGSLMVQGSLMCCDETRVYGAEMCDRRILISDRSGPLQPDLLRQVLLYDDLHLLHCLRHGCDKQR